MSKKITKVPFKTASKEERETTICKTDTDDTWNLYTSDPKMYRDLIKKGDSGEWRMGER